MADKTKAEKIDAIIEQIDNWDLETLIDWAKERRRELLEKESDEVIDEAYHAEVIGDA